MPNETKTTPETPSWFDGSKINESLFCQEFIKRHRLAYAEGSFFTPKGRVADENAIRKAVYLLVEPLLTSGVTQKISSLIDLMKIAAATNDLCPQTDRIHLANGTLFLDGRFEPGQNEIVRARFPIDYMPDAKQPTLWLHFLNGLLYEEDIPTLQEFIGYCLIPSSKGQRMMVIKGKGGEGKSVVGAVLARLFGTNLKDGSVGKISENRFARADLENILLMVDDDMQMEALKQTNYVKSLVTAHGMMDLERKGRQSYQGWLYARILAFSNGDLQSLYDRSDGFYRRQLILTTRERPAGRVDDPRLADKMSAELPGILNWAFEGLRRLAANDFRFTESDRCRESRETVKKEANNVITFLESAGYVRMGDGLTVSSRELYRAYCAWCDENAYTPIKGRSFSDFMVANMQKYRLGYNYNVINSLGHRVRGFSGIGLGSHFPSVYSGQWQEVRPDENPFVHQLSDME